MLGESKEMERAGLLHIVRVGSGYIRVGEFHRIIVALRFLSCHSPVCCVPLRRPMLWLFDWRRLGSTDPQERCSGAYSHIVITS